MLSLPDPKAQEFESFLEKLRHGPWYRRLIVAGFGVLAALSFKDFLPEWSVVPLLSFASLLLLTGGFFFFRRGREPESEPPRTVKGIRPFGLADGALFSRLRRTDLIERISSAVQDSQVALILVRGAPGVGKTSLLEAGVRFALAKDALDWKTLPAVPREDVEKSLLQLLNAKPGQGLEPFLEETRNTPRVVVIDHVERLDKRGRQVVVDAFKRLIAQPGEHRQVWVVVANCEAGDEIWSELGPRVETEHRMKNVLVSPLSLNDAQAAFQQLMAEAGLEADDDVKEAALGEFARDSHVSPLAVGILMEVFHDEMKHNDLERLSMQRCRELGGLPFLITKFLRARISRLPGSLPGEKVADALVILQDGSVKQLASIGASIQSPNEKSLALALLELSSSELRILRQRMIESGALGYQLVDEWASAVRGLSLPLDQEAIRAEEILNKKYQVWRDSRDIELRQRMSGSHYLNSDQLALIQCSRLNISEDKRRYIRLSIRHLWWRWAELGLAALLIASIVVAGCYFTLRRERIITLSAWNMPQGFYQRLGQFRSLVLPGSVQTLDWLPSNIQQVSVENSYISNLRGVPDSVEFLNLSSSWIKDLSDAPKGLKSLIVAHSAGLQSLSSLKVGNLTTLDIVNTSVYDLSSVPRSVKELSAGSHELQSLVGLPPNLESLTLTGSEVRSLAELPDSVKSLKLQGNGLLKIDKLPPFLKTLSVDQSLHGITLPESLTSLTLERVYIDTIPPGVEELKINGACFEGAWPSRLSSLSIHSPDECQPYTAVGKLPRVLVSLGIEWKAGMNAAELPPRLKRMEFISINGPIGLDFRDLPGEVEDISFTLCQATSLSRFPAKLRRLDLTGCESLGLLDGLPESLEELNISHTAINDLKFLRKLPNLKKLNISGTVIERLVDLPSGLEDIVLSGRRELSLEGLPASVQKISILEPQRGRKN
jgi:hypothetical protein